MAAQTDISFWLTYVEGSGCEFNRNGCSRGISGSNKLPGYAA
jgi:hypothetical protein